MENERTLKDRLYEEFARIGKSLSSPKRLEILDLLSQSPKTVEGLAKSTGMTVANVSQHLQTLHHARLVNYQKQGNYVIYKLADSVVSDFMETFHHISEKQLLQVQQIKKEFLNSHFEMEGLSLSELKKRMDNGEVTLLDVRPKEEYEEAHIPGAVSIPVKELQDKLTSLPLNIDVVAYCRGSYCLMSVKAVQLLKQNGIHAYRLEKSVQDWKQFIKQEMK